MNISGSDLKEARERSGLTQTDLANRLHVSLRTIVNWEASTVPRKSVPKVFELLGRTISRIQSEAEYSTFLDTPEGKEFLNESQLFYEDVQKQNQSRSPMAFGHPVDRILRTQIITESLDDDDLLYELLRRRSNFPSDAFGYKGSMSDPDADPDYSNMSEEDAKNYGLAAYKGDPNIGPDELPHEP